MTIDEMITHIERSDISINIETQIIAALRAGQDMRIGIGITTHVKRDGSFSFREAHVGDSWSVIEAMKIWDEVTREEV
jgi:hypothetical protein